MSDVDAARGRCGVADPLREYIAKRDWTSRETYDDLAELSACIYAIETEHARRMEQQARDQRRAACRYLGGVIEDYKHGLKRKRTRK